MGLIVGVQCNIEICDFVQVLHGRFVRSDCCGSGSRTDGTLPRLLLCLLHEVRCRLSTYSAHSLTWALTHIFSTQSRILIYSVGCCKGRSSSYLHEWEYCSRKVSHSPPSHFELRIPGRDSLCRTNFHISIYITFTRTAVMSKFKTWACICLAFAYERKLWVKMACKMMAMKGGVRVRDARASEWAIISPNANFQGSPSILSAHPSSHAHSLTSSCSRRYFIVLIPRTLNISFIKT